MNFIKNKEICFFFSSGRCGTKFLYNFFKLFKNVDAFHESACKIPFHKYKFLIKVKNLNYQYSKKYVRKIKIPFIKKCKRKFYIETGHIVSNGYMPAILSNIPNVKIIKIKRDLLQTAYSTWRIGGFSKGVDNERWYILPSNKMSINKIDIEKWKTMSRAQKCMWFVQEIENQWNNLINNYKFQHYVTEFENFTTSFDELNNICNFIGIPLENKKNNTFDINKKVNRKGGELQYSDFLKEL